VATMRSARTLALSLPEVTEQDHHGMASFRVRGTIFATVPDGTHLRLMVDEAEVHAACGEAPGACEPLYWGRKLAGVVVELPRVPAPLLRELVVEAWRRKAPPTLARSLDPPEGAGHV
jgi:hypothetical protein